MHGLDMAIAKVSEDIRWRDTDSAVWGCLYKVTRDHLKWMKKIVSSDKRNQVLKRKAFVRTFEPKDAMS
jgi:hypothetical protein